MYVYINLYMIIVAVIKVWKETGTIVDMGYLGGGWLQAGPGKSHDKGSRREPDMETMTLFV